jgi:3-oxoacyl-[acyl-carrier protein] reductase
MKMGLQGQSVLITGSSRGIGRGIAEGFLREKALVIITGRDKKILENTALELSNLYGENKILYFVGDLKLSENLKSLKNLIGDKVGRIDHLVCNIGDGKSVSPLNENVLEFQRMLDINLLNAVGVVDELMALIKKSASKKKSFTSITFIGSICGLEALGCPIAYSAAKAALVSYVKNISFPLGKRGIRVNIVSPGNIMFPGSTWEKKIEENSLKVEKMLKNEVPLQRFGNIEDVSNVVVFLASERAKFINGANWVVDGGQTHS